MFKFKTMILESRAREYGIYIILLVVIVLTLIMEKINEGRSYLGKVFNRDKEL